MHRKLEQHHRDSFSGIKLWLEDIEHIISILVGAGFKIEISDNKHIYDSLDEYIEKNGHTPEVLIIEAHLSDPRGSITFELDEPKSYSKERITISSYGDSPHITGTWHECKEYIKSKKYSYTQANLWYVPIFIFLATSIGYILTNNQEVRLLFSALFVASLFWPSIQFSLINSKPIVLLRKRHGNFFSRKKDDLIMLAIGSVLGAVVSTFVSNIM